MVSRWATLIVWTAAAASVVAWALQLLVAAPQAPRGTLVADAARSLSGDVTRVLGADAAPVAQASPTAEAPAADARFQLVGVAAPRSARAGSREGVALIAIDGKPARAYRVGAIVEAPDLVLKRVGARAAELGRSGGGPSIALELPALAPAATGQLAAAEPAAVSVGDARARPQLRPPAAALPAPSPPAVAPQGTPDPPAQSPSLRAGQQTR